MQAKSMKELDRMLEKKVRSEMKSTQDIVHKCIQDSINEFYEEFDPSMYHRTYKFINSLISTEVVRNGNTYTCCVKIDENYLNYEYPNQMQTDLSATGRDVADWANRDVWGYQNHGGTVDAGRSKGFWDVAISELGGKNGILSLLKFNLRKNGINVK